MTSPHFTDEELRCPCCEVNKCESSLLGALETLRRIVDRPIRVNSAYRCPAHNKAVGGAANSQHVLGLAADIVISGMTPRQMYAEALRVPAFAFGGIGVDEERGFIHVDVRPTGMARWSYRDGKECGWIAGEVAA